MILSTIFELKREEVTKSWRKLHKSFTVYIHHQILLG
jgi:hypothetical protein